MNTDQDVYDELALYTLGKGDPEFIHQYIVDAHAAQTADERTKPITIYFALAGLYLHVEKNFSGKEVQRMHMRMAKLKMETGQPKEWPKFDLPRERGKITARDVREASPGTERDEMIRTWSRSVWGTWEESHERVRKLFEIYF